MAGDREGGIVLPRQPLTASRIGNLLLCLILWLALLLVQAAPAQAGRSSNPTGTQGVVGNPNCPPPTINGITPKNWSCPTGTQSPFQQQAPLQGSVTYDETEDLGFLQGAAKGFAECADGLVMSIGSTFVAAGQMLAGDFVGAEKTLGLERGRGTMLRTIMHEASQNALHATPEEAGERIARRICQYFLLAEAARAARPGGTSLNPIKGAEINASWKGLEGRWIEIGERGQVIQVGARKGRGAYGAVYENAGTRGEVIKIMNPAQDMAAAVTRQVQGFFHVLQTGRIPVPKIWNYRLGRNGEAAFIIMEDANRMFPGQRPRWFSSGSTMKAADIEATRVLHEELGAQGYLWADANPGNIFTVTLEDGSVVAGIVDADFIFPMIELAQQPIPVLKSVRMLLNPFEPFADPWAPTRDPVLGPLLRDPARIDGSAVMGEFFNTRLEVGDYGPSP